MGCIPSLPSISDIELLPEGEDHPIRPDLPWLRNLTWVKIHAMQLGFGFALTAYLSLLFGFNGAVVGLLVMVGEFILSERERRDPDSMCDHGLGAHDMREKPWYFLSAAFATYVVMVGLFGSPL